MPDLRQCFVISPIGDSGSEIRKRADQVLRHVIEPASKHCGYDAIRADGISEPGIITAQVIQHILDDPIVIADLTGANPNVFYELAIRHAIRRPLVQIIQKGEKIPFDVAGMRTIPVDHKDLDSVEEAKAEIVKQIKSSEHKKPEELDSPITVTVELQSLRQSDNPEQRSLAEFVAALGDLRSNVAALDAKMSMLFDRRMTVDRDEAREIVRSRELMGMLHDVSVRLRQMSQSEKPILNTEELGELADYIEYGGIRSVKGRRIVTSGPKES
jgi:hypothetical protein